MPSAREQVAFMVSESDNQELENLTTESLLHQLVTVWRFTATWVRDNKSSLIELATAELKKERDTRPAAVAMVVEDAVPVALYTKPRVNRLGLQGLNEVVESLMKLGLVSVVAIGEKQLLTQNGISVVENIMDRLEKLKSNGEMVDSSHKEDGLALQNIKQYTKDLYEHGIHDKPTLHELATIAKAASGSNLSSNAVERVIGVGRKLVKKGKKARNAFDAIASARADDVLSADGSETPSLNSSNESDSSDSDASYIPSVDGNDTDEMELVNRSGSDNNNSDADKKVSRLKRKAGDPNRKEKMNNPFLQTMKPSPRKVRKDYQHGAIVREFNHDHHSGGRLDTHRPKKSVLQLDGSYLYESVRSQPMELHEMLKEFIGSEYGNRWRVTNKNKNISLNQFRKLQCPCMTTMAAQRDTADTVRAEINQCCISLNTMLKNTHLKNALAARDIPVSSLEHWTIQKLLDYNLCPRVDMAPLSINDQNNYLSHDDIRHLQNFNAERMETRDQTLKTNSYDSWFGEQHVKQQARKAPDAKNIIAIPDTAIGGDFSYFPRCCCYSECLHCGKKIGELFQIH